MHGEQCFADRVPLTEVTRADGIVVFEATASRACKTPRARVISAWIWARLKPQLPELSSVTVYETASCGAHFDGQHYRFWKEMTLDSSLQLKRAPDGDKRRRIHGHTYTLRLHLNAPLDTVMGWTIDFGDVKELFDPIFKRIDHHPLHELPGVAQRH